MNLTAANDTVEQRRLLRNAHCL